MEDIVFESAENTLTALTLPGGVKLSFFGGLKFQMVYQSTRADNGISIASLGDIFGNKCAVVQKRAEFKDYFDICSILEETDFTLADGLAIALAMYGPSYNPLSTLKALSYFDDLERSLPEIKARALLEAVKAVDLGNLPVLKPMGKVSPAPESATTPATSPRIVV